MEDIISLKKYGFNALANMMIFAKYLNFGGGVIIRRHDNDDYEMEYYSNETLVTNTPEDLTTTPDVNTSLMIVYSWLESVSITEIGFYIDEAYKMFMTDSEEERFMYRKRMYYKTKDRLTGKKLSSEREKIILTLDEFRDKIINVENKNINCGINEFNNLFDIDRFTRENVIYFTLHN